MENQETAWGQESAVQRISVVIPLFNGEATIRGCLESLVEQARAYQAEVEIIVVDDGSTDRSPDVVAGYRDVQYVKQEQNAGPAKARNVGADRAKGDIVLFTDADCVVGDRWVEEMIRPFKEDPLVVGVKGVYKTRQRELTSRFVQLEYEDKYDKMAREKTIDFIDTYSAGYRRAVFLKMGGFDCRFPVACAEDVELSFRMAEQGYRMVFNSRAYVYHQHPSTWLDYVRKKYKYAYWRAVAVRSMPRKVLNDSHSPLFQKVQIFLVPMALASACSAWVFPWLTWMSMAVWTAVGLTMIPFIAKGARRDPVPALCAPAYLIPRALVQAVAVFKGLIAPQSKREWMAAADVGSPPL